jgi:myo-inositol-1(or 4)-monophosphatase
VDDAALLDLLDDTARAVAGALDTDAAKAERSWRDRGERPGQYRIDLVADDAALAVLRAAGVGILSEESGLEDRGNDLVVVVDPVDGSTNASRGIPWYATSLCAVDADGPRAALVVNLATGTRYQAVRGGGATRDGRPIAPSDARSLDMALLVLNGYSPTYLQWRQYRALGATALDLCSVADGRVDGTIDCTDSALGPWDYMGAMLVLGEVGAHIADAQGRELVVLDHEARRTPVSAGTEELFDAVLAARRAQPEW